AATVSLAAEPSRQAPIPVPAKRTRAGTRVRIGLSVVGVLVLAGLVVAVLNRPRDVTDRATPDGDTGPTGADGDTPPVVTPGTWNDLLTRRPEVIYSFDPDRHAHFWYEEKIRRAGLHTSGVMLVKLGQANSTGFVLRLRIRHERLPAGFGLFFAGRQDPE